MLWRIDGSESVVELLWAVEAGVDKPIFDSIHVVAA